MRRTVLVNKSKMDGVNCPDLLRCLFEHCVLLEGRDVLFKLACVSRDYEIAGHHAIVDYFSYYEEDRFKKRVQLHTLYTVSLDLSYDNGVSIGPEELEKMKYMRTLNLYKNTKFPGSFLKSLKTLTSLNLGDNAKIAGEDISTLISLKTLNLYWYAYCNEFRLDFSRLSNSLITDVALLQLTNLTKLNLCGCKTVTNQALPLLPSLVNLNISFNTVITNEGMSFFSRTVAILTILTGRSEQTHQFGDIECVLQHSDQWAGILWADSTEVFEDLWHSQPAINRAINPLAAEFEDSQDKEEGSPVH